MERKLPFKYYAVRVLNTVIFRRTVTQLSKVQSKLYKPGTNFVLTQVTYIGGRIIGSMSYTDWVKFGGKGFNTVTKVPREQYRSLLPYMQKAED